ncbi:SMC family ATPase [Weeksella virosa]|uniref:AAA family ATPase n=1 Tax=Weeksella virosa TaxID=1014 RepID=UPI002553D6A5|nr:SMC family ATPase [Weeksella virosa]MDK7674989.1 SMC family ATPase [Weeksella virosa]
MLPLVLRFEGLYSYQEPQEIDFSSLIDAGLFGIFGKVGSGKSTILEAITFALYGNSDRLGSSKFTYNMMNLKSNKMLIDFEFLNHENKKYKIVREYRRNRNNFEIITQKNAQLYEFRSNDWYPLESLDVEPIIGLSSDNFRRTIIIPQGKFQEFIQLTPTQRTHMLKEIFSLQRFDLQDKVSAFNKKNLELLNKNTGRLSTFENVTETQIEELSSQLSTSIIQEEKYRTEHQNLQEVVEKLRQLKETLEEQQSKKKALEKLLIEEKGIRTLEKQTKQYEQLSQGFSHGFDEQNKLQKKVNDFLDEQQKEEKELLLLKDKINQTEKEMASLLPQFEALADKKIEEKDLEFILSILRDQAEIENLQLRSRKGIEMITEEEKKETSHRNLLATLQNKQKELEQKRENIEELYEIEKWYQKYEILEKQIAEQENKISKNKADILSTEKQFNPHLATQETLTRVIDEEFSKLEKSNETLREQIQNLTVRQQLSHYAMHLHEGEACPLCGSLQHPNLIDDDVSEQLQNLRNKLLLGQEKEKTLQKDRRNLENSFSEIKFRKEQLAKEELELEKLFSNQKNLIDTFVWKKFRPTQKNDFLAKKKQALEVENLLTEATKEIENERLLLDNTLKNIEKYKEGIQGFRDKENQAKARIELNSKNLQRLSVSDYAQQSQQEIRLTLDSLKSRNLEIEQKQIALQEEKNNLLPKVAKKEAMFNSIAKQLHLAKTELISIEKTLLERLSTTEFTTLEEVKRIVHSGLNVDENWAKIHQFELEKNALSEMVLELENKLKDQVFEEENYQTKITELASLAQKHKESNERMIALKTEKERLEKAFEEKKNLLKEQEKLERKAQNLSTLQNLFNRAGFVQYISGIYLQQLCDNANVRFHRMTRNQLSLQINENSDFEIIDYLNEGKSRSVKTLSGGQAFQVSLSLALALAESVQENVSTNKNFFFIDEGFGTQDSEAVNIVFETLLSLQKENRIVGIISHVDELKERIPITLSITKDEVKGSRIDLQ